MALTRKLPKAVNIRIKLTRKIGQRSDARLPINLECSLLQLTFQIKATTIHFLFKRYET